MCRDGERSNNLVEERRSDFFGVQEPFTAESAECAEKNHYGSAFSAFSAVRGFRAIYPQTSRAVSTISDNFAISSSIVSAFPSTVDENPHCGLRQS